MGKATVTFNGESISFGGRTIDILTITGDLIFGSKATVGDRRVREVLEKLIGKGGYWLLNMQGVGIIDRAAAEFLQDLHFSNYQSRYGFGLVILVSQDCDWLGQLEGDTEDPKSIIEAFDSMVDAKERCRSVLRSMAKDSK